MPLLLALTADDAHKDELVSFVQQYQTTLAAYQLLATQRTNDRLQRDCDRPVINVQSNAMGGLVELAAHVVAGEVAAVIDWFDPTIDAVLNPDRQSLWRMCVVHNVPYATNKATAIAILSQLGQRRIAHLIFNPVAGQGNPTQELAQIREHLAPEIQLNTVLTQPDVSPTVQVQEILEQITSSQPTDETEHLVIASGGDGTVSAIASALINTNIPLGIIPRGTANAFAAALDIPNTIPEACKLIRLGQTRLVDTARCNDTPMILLAGVGFEAGMVDKADRELKRQFGTLAYLMAGVQQLTEQEPFQAQIEMDEKNSDFETVAITVANVAPATSLLAQGFGQVIPDDGLLEVTISTSKTRLERINTLASLFAAAVVKSPSNREDIVCLRTHRLTVTTDPQQPLVIDGEMEAGNPIVFECVPKSLRVLTPISGE